MTHKATACLVTALLAACTGTPPPISKVQLPAPLPERYGREDAELGDLEDRIPEQWWRDFNDPELNAFVEQSLSRNQDLLAASARLEAAVAQSRIASAPLSPQLDIGLDGNRGRRLFLGFPFGNGDVPGITTTTFGLSMNLGWELDVWGRLRADASAQLAELQAQTADFSGARLSLAAQTCRGYFAVAEARQQLALARATAANLQATANDVRGRFRRGVRPALDIYQATTNLAEAESNIALRERQLQVAVRQLEVLRGDYPDGQILGSDALTTKLPLVPTGLPSMLLNRRPDLAAAERRLAASGCRVDAAKAALYPRFSLTASGGTGSETLGDLLDDASHVWSLGGNLLQPLLRGGALRADVARSEALQREAMASYGGSVLKAFAEVETALVAGTWLAQQSQSASQAMTQAAQARDLARQRYQAGLSEFLIYANSQRQAFATESSYITVQRLRIDNRIDLILALGGGFETEPPEVQTTP